MILRIAFASVLLTASLTAQKKSDFLSVGIVRGDGILVPVARFQDSTWSNIYDNPDAWDQKENTAHWFFYKQAEKPDSLFLGTLVSFNIDHPNHLTSGILSSYTANEGFHPSGEKAVAVAFTADTLRPIAFTEIHRHRQSLTPRLDHAVDSLFHSLEDLYAKYGSLVGMSIPSSRKHRDTLPIECVHFLSDTSIEGIRYDHFRASRQYPRANCPAISELTGWMVETPNSLNIVNHKFTVDDCDGKELGAHLLPYAMVQLAERTFILTGLRFYEGDGFDILEFRNGRMYDLLENHLYGE